MKSIEPSTNPSPPPTKASGRAARVLCVWTSLLVALIGFVWSSGKGDQAHAQPGTRARRAQHTAVRASILGAAPVAGPIPEPIALPIEVMGANGTTVTVGVQVPRTQGPITTLWMQAHGLSYENKASVKVNSGPWLPLNNQSTTVEEPGKSYGGIGGGFSTLKFSLRVSPPMARFSPGLNHISFRFNRTDGVSIGFRVIKLQLKTAQGKPVLAANSFVDDDPSQWRAPLTDDADIAAGAQLWHTAQLEESDLVGAPAILATCSDCHTQDGHDLKYFNFSNHSIIERSKFHGLTETQGEQIASYIRTLKNADGTDMPSPGRPWNPPYQPGPGVDEKPVSEWAAGAGVDAVLDKDTDMVPYLFPNGINKDAIAGTQTLNMRELPIALQLIDWNHWLPRVHPKDAFGRRFTSSVMNTQYNNLEGYLTGAHSSPDIKFQFDYWEAEAAAFQTGLVFPNGGDNDSDKAPLTPFQSLEVYSTAQWHAVQEWSLMQKFGLEGRGSDFFGAKAEGQRQWLSSTAFFSSPAQVKVPSAGVPGTPWNDNITFNYLNVSWYQLQLILNAGNRQRQGNNPVDWGYLPGRMTDLQYSSARSVPIVLLAAQLIKGMQEQDNGVGPSGDYGYAPNNMSAINMLGTFFTGPVNTGVDLNAGAWKTAPPGTRAQVLTAYLGAYFDLLQKFAPSQYYQDDGYGGIAQSSEDPAVYANRLGFKLYSSIPSYRAIGVDGTLLNNMCDWAKTVWPVGHWDRLKR